VDCTTDTSGYDFRKGQAKIQLCSLLLKLRHHVNCTAAQSLAFWPLAVLSFLITSASIHAQTKILECNMISIIIPARNNAALTRACLSTAIQSIRLLDLNVEFILIDDASDRSEGLIDLFQHFRRQAPKQQFTLVRAKKQLHYTGVFSVGLHLAKLENVFFLSNDMQITPHFISAVLGVAALSRDFGIIRGTSEFTDSHPEHVVRPPDCVRSYNDFCTFSKAMFEINGLRFTEDQILSGDAILIKRAVLEQIGVMDMQFFGYFGDIDFGLRCHLAGFKLICAKGAWLHHEGAGHVKSDAAKTKTAYSQLHQERMRLVEEAYQLFRKKWDTNLPATYGQVTTLKFFSVADKNRSRVDLRYELPSEVHNTYDIL
jgi:GT2 family glycosyltransferase